MLQLDQIMRATIFLHCQGKHRNAIISTWITSGSYELADDFGKRLGMRSNHEHIAMNIMQHNAILQSLKTHEAANHG